MPRLPAFREGSLGHETKVTLVQLLSATKISEGEATRNSKKMQLLNFISSLYAACCQNAILNNFGGTVLSIVRVSLVPRPHPPERVAWYPLFAHALNFSEF